MKEKEYFWKWLGKSEFVPGVPARDLTRIEVNSRGIQSIVEKSPLYKKVLEKSQKKGDE